MGRVVELGVTEEQLEGCSLVRWNKAQSGPVIRADTARVMGVVKQTHFTILLCRSVPASAGCA